MPTNSHAMIRFHDVVASAPVYSSAFSLRAPKKTVIVSYRLLHYPWRLVVSTAPANDDEDVFARRYSVS